MEYLLENLNERRGMERTSSFFVGDAAGRVQGWRAGYPKDFSDSDRKFALNAEIAFYTPEAFFRGEAEATKFVLSGFDPRPLRNQGWFDEPRLRGDDEVSYQFSLFSLARERHL